MIKQQQFFSAPKNINKNQVQRTSKYELLRFLAAFMVIFFHASFGYGRSDWLYTNMNILMTVPVLLFVFISGFFLVKTKKNRTIKFLWILLIYYLINIVVSIAFLSAFGLLGKAYTIKQLLKFGWGPWWYFWSLPFLYLLTPVLNYIIKNLHRYYSLLLAILIYSAYYFYSGINYGTILPPTQLILFCAIYLFGAWWQENGYKYHNKKSILFLAITYLIALQLADNIMFAINGKTVFMSMNDGAKDTSQPLTVIAAWAIFVIFQNIKLPFNKFINFLGQLSLPIYLFQGLTMTIIGNKIMPLFAIDNAMLGTLTFALVSLVWTLIVALILIYPINLLINYGNSITERLIEWLKKHNTTKIITKKLQKNIDLVINNQN